MLSIDNITSKYLLKSANLSQENIEKLVVKWKRIITELWPVMAGLWCTVGWVWGCLWITSGGLLFWFFLPLEGILFFYQIVFVYRVDVDYWPWVKQEPFWACLLGVILGASCWLGLGEFLVILLLGFMGMKAWEVRFEVLPSLHANGKKKWLLHGFTQVYGC